MAKKKEKALLVTAQLIFSEKDLKAAKLYGRKMHYTHERDEEWGALLLTAAMAGIIDYDIENVEMEEY